jgi:hypothetical protein
MTHHRNLAVGTVLLEFLVGGGNDAPPAEAPKGEVSPKARTATALAPVPFTPKYRFRDGLESAITEITNANLDGFRQRTSRVSRDTLGYSVTRWRLRTKELAHGVGAVDPCNPTWASSTLMLSDLEVERRLMMTCSSRQARSPHGLCPSAPRWTSRCGRS